MQAALRHILTTQLFDVISDSNLSSFQGRSLDGTRHPRLKPAGLSPAVPSGEKNAGLSTAAPLAISG
jgi:hypothetical protein